jgi:hypothetical protein
MPKHPEPSFKLQENEMKTWIMRLLALLAVAGVLAGCAGFGPQSGGERADYETSLSD